MGEKGLETDAGTVGGSAPIIGTGSATPVGMGGLGSGSGVPLASERPGAGGGAAGLASGIGSATSTATTSGEALLPPRGG